MISAPGLSETSSSRTRDRESAHRAPRHVLVAGASGGIGSALCSALQRRFDGVHVTRLMRQVEGQSSKQPGISTAAIDFCKPDEIEAVISGLDAKNPPDWILIATGWLHDERWQPEKTFRHLDAAHLAHAYQVNAIGPIMLLNHLAQRFWKAPSIKFGVLSARVGSISDNRLGGWYAYRSSKAALNMMLKNFSIEIARSRPGWCVVGLHPGTTDTRLSAPFQARLPAGQLQTAESTAHRLLALMQRLEPQQSGALYDYNGDLVLP